MKSNTTLYINVLEFNDSEIISRIMRDYSVNKVKVFVHSMKMAEVIWYLNSDKVPLSVTEKTLNDIQCVARVCGVSNENFEVVRSEVPFCVNVNDLPDRMIFLGRDPRPFIASILFVCENLPRILYGCEEHRWSICDFADDLQEFTRTDLSICETAINYLAFYILEGKSFVPRYASKPILFKCDFDNISPTDIYNVISNTYANRTYTNPEFANLANAVTILPEEIIKNEMRYTFRHLVLYCIRFYMSVFHKRQISYVKPLPWWYPYPIAADTLIQEKPTKLKAEFFAHPLCLGGNVYQVQQNRIIPFLNKPGEMCKPLMRPYKFTWLTWSVLLEDGMSPLVHVGSGACQNLLSSDETDFFDYVRTKK